jgi:2-octaprenyl-3-methyl-6-methoxy-1,4-benzoquinol hydroxylase
MLSTDVIIVGGGMVGALTAAALGACGVDVVLLEKSAPAPFDADVHDLRVSAVSEASERMLDAVGAWDTIRDMRVCPYRRMLVWESESSAETLFDSSSIGLPHLGHIVENRVIQLGLWQQLEAMDNVRIVCPGLVESLNVDKQQVIVSGNGQTYAASLLIAADGANSAVRSLAQIAVEGESYEQHALVATVTTSDPQQDITWQRFTPNGPQAFLPLCGHRASMVWYESAETVSMLKQLPAEEFLRAMETAFPERLGKLNSLEGIGSFPLQWQHAGNYVQPRVALVGDAAHSVHPLAGQGVNMGLLDAAVLVECIVEQHAKGADIGAMRALRRYERWRKPQNSLMIRMLDGIQQAFQPQQHAAMMGALRALALRGADNIRPLNSLCIKLAMGLEGDLPQLARGRLPKLSVAGR